LQVHPLGIGGKEDPARLVFNSPAGEAINVSLVDMGTRFRLIISEVIAVQWMIYKTSCSTNVWDCKPNLDIAATAWILAGGSYCI
jgi:L-arabinose isomerase